MTAPNLLLEPAMRLRGFNAELWDDFVRAMGECAANAAAEVLRHPPETILRAQGAAIAVNEIYKSLRDAPQLYEKLREARHGR